MKREIGEELRFHLGQRTAENLGAGMTPEEAAREAHEQFGNLQSIREECRDARVTPGVWTVTRVKPVLGRCFTEQDVASGNDGLVVLSYGVWRERFNGSQDVIGR